jgi:ATP-binding cassette subfamily F protein 3
VSHNQSFVNRLATKIWDIEGGEIIEYPGNLDEYFYHIARAKEESANGYSPGISHAKEVGKNASVKKGQDRKKEKKSKAEKRQRIYDTLKPILAEVDRLEGRIAELEVKQKKLEILLAEPDMFSGSNGAVTLIGEHKGLGKKLDELLLKWEQTQDKLETTRRELEVGNR